MWIGLLAIKLNNENDEVKDKINSHFCNGMTEHYSKEEKKPKGYIRIFT